MNFEPQQSPWNLSRALWATSLCAVFGATVPVALAVIIALCRWAVGPSELASEWFRRDLEENIINPVVGCGVVCACAGFATFAPSGKHSFAWSLAIIFLISLVIWTVIAGMELTPRRLKGVEHPVFYLSGLIAMIAPPSVVSAFLTMIRTRRLPKSVAANGL